MKGKLEILKIYKAFSLTVAKATVKENNAVDFTKNPFAYNQLFAIKSIRHLLIPFLNNRS